MSDVRAAVVVALLESLAGQATEVEFANLADSATDTERAAAARCLARAALRVGTPAPSLLQMNYRDTMKLGLQGLAVMWAADQLGPVWATRPDVPLSDIAKVIAPERLAHIASELCSVNLHDMCSHDGDNGPAAPPV